MRNGGQVNPGPRFGGSCFPEDTLALTKLAADARAPIRLVETLVDVNDKRKVAMAAKVVAACGGSMAGKRLAVLGLTYKPKTNDMRDAPSLVIVPDLQAAGGRKSNYRDENERIFRPQIWTFQWVAPIPKHPREPEPTPPPSCFRFGTCFALTRCLPRSERRSGQRRRRQRRRARRRGHQLHTLKWMRNKPGVYAANSESDLRSAIDRAIRTTTVCDKFDCFAPTNSSPN